MDYSRVPVSPQERGTGWTALLGLVKQDLEKGTLKDWGSYIGEARGYAIGEGSEVELGIALQKYVPYVKLKLHSIGSVTHNQEIMKALSA